MDILNEIIVKFKNPTAFWVFCNSFKAYDWVDHGTLCKNLVSSESLWHSFNPNWLNDIRFSRWNYFSLISLRQCFEFLRVLPLYLHFVSFRYTILSTMSLWQNRSLWGPTQLCFLEGRNRIYRIVSRTVSSLLNWLTHNTLILNAKNLFSCNFYLTTKIFFNYLWLKRVFQLNFFDCPLTVLWLVQTTQVNSVTDRCKTLSLYRIFSYP